MQLSLFISLYYDFLNLLSDLFYLQMMDSLYVNGLKGNKQPKAGQQLAAIRLQRYEIINKLQSFRSKN